MSFARWLQERLKLVEYDFEVTPVRVQFLKDVERVPLPSGIVNMKRGDEVEMPRWQARILASEGLVEIKERALTIDEVNLYHYREKRSQAAGAIQGLQQDFYLKVRELVRSLNEEIKRNPTSMLLRDRETLEKNLLDLAESRLVKIMSLAQAGGEEYREKMTPEETIIYEALRSLLATWREYISRLARG